MHAAAIHHIFFSQFILVHVLAMLMEAADSADTAVCGHYDIQLQDVQVRVAFRNCGMGAGKGRHICAMLWPIMTSCPPMSSSRRPCHSMRALLSAWPSTLAPKQVFWASAGSVAAPVRVSAGTGLARRQRTGASSGCASCGLCIKGLFVQWSFHARIMA